MRKGFYIKFAYNNIKKNYRFFIPRILSELGLIACFYIVYTLSKDNRLASVRGGEYISFMMAIGTIVMAILSFILLLYINSFLMKQRKREFGIYSVLGLEKRHITRILFHESFISSLVSQVLGIIFGILFYKLSSLLICKFLAANIVLGFYFIKLETIIPCVLFYTLIDFVTFLGNRRNVYKTKTTELLQSKAKGEKEPKIKWIMLVIGILSLGGGYYISLTVDSFSEAIFQFFVAVGLVILGTYFIFVAGSIFVLKTLKKNKKFYYQKRHMTAVSGLLYRMKQNAVGLSSITILATMVLVMISTTISLYSGTNKILKQYYPEEFSVYVTYSADDYTSNITVLPEEELLSIINKVCSDEKVEVEYEYYAEYLRDTYFDDNGGYISKKYTDNEYNENLSKIASITFITEETYKKATGKSLDLKDRNIAICNIGVNKKYQGNFISIDGISFSIKEKLNDFPIVMGVGTNINYGIVLPNKETLNEIYELQAEVYQEEKSDIEKQYRFKFDSTNEMLRNGYEFEEKFDKTIYDYFNSRGIGHYRVKKDGIWEAKDRLYGMYGTLLFLGIILGIVCIFATVLIMYYKQISEGYEDRERFQIMKKVGLGDSEVKKTIKSQTLLVFFLPLVFSGIHIAFAFNMLNIMLSVLMLTSVLRLFICTAIVYVFFAIIYIIIYNRTAKTYYKIVNWS